MYIYATPFTAVLTEKFKEKIDVSAIKLKNKLGPLIDFVSFLNQTDNVRKVVLHGDED